MLCLLAFFSGVFKFSDVKGSFVALVELWSEETSALGVGRIRESEELSSSGFEL